MLARPALHAIRAGWPAATLHGMARAGHVGLVERLSLFDRIDPAPEPGVLAGALSVRRAARAIRRFAPDAALLLAPSFEAALVVRLAGVPRRIGHDTDGRGRLLTDAVAPRPQAHRADEYGDLSDCLTGGDGVDAPGVMDRLPPLVLTDEDRAYGARVVRAMGWPHDCRPVFVNPAAAKTARAWSSDRYRAVVEHLAAPAAAGGRQVIVHARPPFEAPDGWAAAQGVALAGEATLPELAALLERCALYVGNDSGPAHLAAAAGIPTVSLHGSSWPFRTGPRGVGGGSPQVAVTAAFGCSPCRERFFEECPSPPTADGRPPCLDDIPTDSVIRVVERMLSRVSP